jgi:hypothetical protein
MQTNDSFDPALPLPGFLADETEEQGFGDVLDRGVTASRFFKASVLIAAVTATGIAVLAIGDPVALFADVTATLVSKSPPQPASDQPAPAIQTAAANAPALIQPTADAQALPATAKDVPARDEIAASEPAKDQAKDQTETSEPSPESEALFRRFQAWVSEQDAQAQAGPVQTIQDATAQVAQNDPAPIAENDRAPRRLTQKHRQSPSVHNAKAEMRTQNVRRPVRRPQEARAERPPVQPVQDARAQDPSGSNAQAPGFLSIFGQRN